MTELPYEQTRSNPGEYEVAFGAGAEVQTADAENAEAESDAADNWFEELADAIRAVEPPDNGGRPPELIPKYAELTPKDFEKLGPRAAEIMKEHGVTKLSLTPGKTREDVHHAKIEFKDGAEIDLDDKVDGVDKLKIGKELSFNIQMTKDGEIIFTNIKGLEAILPAGMKVPITGLRIGFNADGKAEITATSEVGGKKSEHKFAKSYEAMEDVTTYYNKFLELIGLRCP